MNEDSAGSVDIPRGLNFNSVLALGCIALGIAIWLLVPYQVAEPPSFFGRSSGGISPRLFPQILAVGFVVIGILYLFASRKMTDVNAFRALSASAYVNLAVILIAMIADVALLRPIGYVASSILISTAIAIYYGSRSVVGIAITGFLAPVIIYLLFTRMLSVSLPPFPWG